MSNFDFAFGFNHIPLDQACATLFATPSFYNKYFKGVQQEQVDPLGLVSFSYEVMAAPTFVLAPPTDDLWNKSVKKAGITTKPAQNLFQVHFSDFQGTVTIPHGKPLAGRGAIDIYAVASQQSSAITLQPVAVYIDESAFNAWDKLIVNRILIPRALNTATTMLGAIQIPVPSSFEGVSFAPFQLSIQSNLLLGVAITTTNTSLLDTGNVQWPNQPCFNLCSQPLLNAVITPMIQKYKGSTSQGTESSGAADFTASAEYTATLNNISAQVLPGDPRVIQLSVSLGLSVHGSISNDIVPARACPVASALGAI